MAGQPGVRIDPGVRVPARRALRVLIAPAPARHASLVRGRGRDAIAVRPDALVAVVSVVMERIVTARSPERVVIDDGVGAGSSPAGENNDRGEDRACHGLYSFEQSLPSFSGCGRGTRVQERSQITNSPWI